MNRSLELVREMDEADGALERAQEAYLRHWGWIRTCRFPGSYWLWERDLADADAKYEALYKANGNEARGLKHTPWGKVAGVSTDIAVRMTMTCLQEWLEGEEE